MVNRREWRLETAKRLLAVNPKASAAEIALQIHQMERRMRTPKGPAPVGKFLGGWKQWMG